MKYPKYGLGPAPPAGSIVGSPMTQAGRQPGLNHRLNLAGSPTDRSTTGATMPPSCGTRKDTSLSPTFVAALSIFERNSVSLPWM